MVNIAGVPHWLQIVRFGRPSIGDWIYVGNNISTRVTANAFAGGSYLIVTPNNVYNRCNLENIKLPDGYEWTGEYRSVEAGELYFNLTFQLATTIVKTLTKYMILKRKKQKYIVLKWPATENKLDLEGVKKYYRLDGQLPVSATVVEE